MHDLGRWIDSIKINAITATSRGGRDFWVKRRRAASRLLIPCANAFFRAVGNPVEVLARRPEWQAWEVDSFHLLHGGEGFRAFTEGGSTVCAEQLPGVSLEEIAAEEGLRPPILAAAARELRRAHALPSARFQNSGWSHADPHIGNFLFDSATGRARLIDFEAAHHPHLSATERHADDLLVVIQCLMYYFKPEPWLAAATGFLRAYLAPETEEAEETAAIIAALRRRLCLPTGLARLWWAIRVGYIPAAECHRRLMALQQSLACLPGTAAVTRN